MEDSKFKYLGKRSTIIDGPEKLMGKAHYAGDLSFPNMLHVKLFLSEHAHAKVIHINKEHALKIPGVKAVFTAEDLTQWYHVSASRIGALLARGEAVFAGHPIAAVVGDSPEAASDGLSCIEVDYEILPVVSDIEKALCKDAPLVWEKGIPRDESDVSSEHADIDKKNEDYKDLPRNCLLYTSDAADE